MGNLQEDMKKNAVVIQKPSGAIAIRVDLNAVQRKFYDALLHIAKQDLLKNGNKKTFIYPLSWLKSVLGKNETDKNNSYYIAKLKELKHKEVEYNVLKKDKIREWGAVSLVSALYVKDEDDTVMVKFELPEDIIHSLIDPNGIYANLNLVVIRGLSSKYAITLYELAKDYEKVEIPEMTMKEFRKIFNVEDKYESMKDLKKRVLDVAVREINESDSMDFLIDYKMRKLGPKYTHIKFTTKPKPAKLKLQHQANKIIESEVKENPDLQELILLLPADLRNRAKIVNIVLGGIENKGKDYTKAQIEYVIDKFNKGKVKSVEIYLKKAIEKDYASAEKINLDNIVDDWKQKLVDLKKVYILDGNDYVMKLIQNCADEDGMCDVQFVSTENSEKIRWSRVPEEKLKDIIEKNKT